MTSVDFAPKSSMANSAPGLWITSVSVYSQQCTAGTDISSHTVVSDGILVCVCRHPSAAVDFTESVTSPRGGSAHWSGVPGFS